MLQEDAPRVPLTIQQANAIISYIGRLPKAIMQRGRALAESGAVLDLEWVEVGKTLHATVQGGSVYDLEVRFGRINISGTSCDCEYGLDCKHAAAALLHVLADFMTERMDAVNKPGFVVSGPAPAAKKTKTKSSARAAESAPPKREGLVGMLMERLGTTRIPAAALKCLETIEAWWRAKKQSVPQSEIVGLSGFSTYYSARTETALHPTDHPPASVWELLHLVDYVIRSSHSALPSPLQGLIDKDLQQRLIAPWEKEKEVARWRTNLASWTQTSAAPEAGPLMRIALHEEGAHVEWRRPWAHEFTRMTQSQMSEWFDKLRHGHQTSLDAGSKIIVQNLVGDYGYFGGGHYKMRTPGLSATLGALLSLPSLREQHLTDANGGQLEVAEQPLKWELDPPAQSGGDYALKLVDDQGSVVRPPISITNGAVQYYVTPTKAWPVNGWVFGQEPVAWPLMIPAAAFETKEGVTLLERLALTLPEKLAKRVRTVRAEILVCCRIHQPAHSKSDYFQVTASADFKGAAPSQHWGLEGWRVENRNGGSQRQPKGGRADDIVLADGKDLQPANWWIREWELKAPMNWQSAAWYEQRIQGKDFPDRFLEWMERRPSGVIVELDAELASLRDGKVSGTVRLDVEESGLDWFDLRVALSVSDTTLTQEEIALLLKAQGRWVRIAGKGWRKLSYDLTPEQEAELAELGLATAEFNGETQRLHALQLVGTKSGSGLFTGDCVQEVKRRAQEIQTRVTPELPEGITATLRPYQTEGFHFLSYLTSNRFGGILADDMGLGKTLQTLAWLAWLRNADTGGRSAKGTTLVICPKSVQANWRSEAERFFPGLRVAVWQRDTAGTSGLDDDADVLVIHYQHLRLHEEALMNKQWHAVILDEAQAIKNPSSQTHRIACALKSEHRLALTGTPIENRLLDLWSIMSFAMPGALGTRAHFTKHFDANTDPLARRRLAARVRPFLLRRTKKEVASDLPDRIEEDLICELEGPQAKLYSAELKRARAHLLKAQTNKQLDKLRFNILTSLLRLRQICCHPALVGHDDKKATSAKLEALMDVLEPLMEEGNKVLVFSQFVEMLSLIETELVARRWPYLKLTGQTDDRGALVKSFQEKEGPATFLISLKAGGFGLNLTAASYVVLFDPWWNPAVEAQAIDRTHRIGQKQNVITYRLLVKDSIEEKIRRLQKKKGAMANDILGEENFAKALTLDDFRYLLGED